MSICIYRYNWSLLIDLIPILRVSLSLERRTASWTCPVRLPRCAERLGVTVKVTAELVVQQLHKAAKGASEGPPTSGSCIFAIHQLAQKNRRDMGWNAVSYLNLRSGCLRCRNWQSSWLQGGPETLRCAYHFLSAEWREGRLDVEALRRNGVWMLNRHLAQGRFGGGNEINKDGKDWFTPLAFIHLICSYGDTQAQATRTQSPQQSCAPTLQVKATSAWNRHHRACLGSESLGTFLKKSFQLCQIPGFQPELGRCSTTDFFVAWPWRYACCSYWILRVLWTGCWSVKSPRACCTN